MEYRRLVTWTVSEKCPVPRIDDALEPYNLNMDAEVSVVEKRNDFCNLEVDGMNSCVAIARVQLLLNVKECILMLIRRNIPLVKVKNLNVTIENKTWPCDQTPSSI